MKVLFVCTGNTCRSPMASAMFKRIVEDDGKKGQVFCFSAGLAAVDGVSPSENAIEACREIGLDISGYKSKKLTPEDTEIWDVYFPMSRTQAYILEKAGVPASKIYTPSYIEDPFGGSLEEYRKCRDKLEKELKKFYNEWVLRLFPLMSHDMEARPLDERTLDDRAAQ